MGNYGIREERKPFEEMTLEELEALAAEERRKKREAVYSWRERNKEYYSLYQKAYRQQRKRRFKEALQKARAAQQEGGEQK